MFGKKPLTLNRVYDTVTIQENGKKLTLHVNADANRLVVGLAQAQKRLMTISEETTDEERDEISRFFSGIIFGDEQTDKLFDFYYGDASCVIALCGTYFANRLNKLITKSQKKALGK